MAPRSHRLATAACCYFVVSGCAQPPAVTAPDQTAASPSAAPSAVSTLGTSCGDASQCAEGETCRQLCADGIAEFAEGDCDPSPRTFCDHDKRREPLPPEQFMFVLAEGGLYGVLHPLPSPHALAEAPVTVRALTKDTAIVGRPAPDAMVSAQARALVGREFSLMGPHGPSCTATVVGMNIIALEPWPPAEEAPPLSVGDSVDPEVLYYSQQNGAVYLAATFDSAQKCSDVVWARARDLPPVEIATNLAIDATQHAHAIETFSALPAARIHAERFAAEVPAASPEQWTQHREGGGYGPSLVGFKLHGSSQVVVTTSVGDVCIGYAAQLMASIDPSTSSIAALAWDTALRPTTAIDLDHDGRLELIEKHATDARFWSPTLTTPGQFHTAQPTSGC